MILQNSYRVVLFKSVNQTMWAEKILREKGIPHKLIPVPRQISSDCGVCLRVESGQEEHVRNVLVNVEGFMEIVPL
ncbi:MAG TPA: DUF3343 domain-containing protein [Spirochaetota bacterium]|nr:DUF3343 domain-containing protein [Spirochaetota bacterium]HPC42752.1 DUF3343 domain-containing protein [Spirochaetota bacterium]HPL17392.1 DUF3343 domain-containing protein [Spirochaetota bacterium]HQF07613.1 DUF3343 domain-containing protein [Spirochaetota bacterium]HQH96344.1 DUF3343 domain-containing protein [Spirochaetota bacterium]